MRKNTNNTSQSQQQTLVRTDHVFVGYMIVQIAVGLHNTAWTSFDNITSSLILLENRNYSDDDLCKARHFRNAALKNDNASLHDTQPYHTLSRKIKFRQYLRRVRTASIVFLSMTKIPSTLTPIGSPFSRFRNTFT